MKKYIIIMMLFGVTISVANAGSDFNARLVDVEIFKGDKGKSNACKLNNILVQESYKISNTEIKGIVMAHWSNNYGLSLKRLDWVIQGTNLLPFHYCVKKGFKADVQTKFINPKGDRSNLVKFSIDTDSLKLK